MIARWRRWLKGTGAFPGLNLARGTLFDTLEQGSMAANSGYGISIGDLLLSVNAIKSGRLALPFPQAVATGDSDYFVCPKSALTHKNSALLYQHLKASVPYEIPDYLRLLPKMA